MIDPRHIAQDPWLEDPLRPKKRHAETVEDESLRQDRPRQHLSADLDLRREPLERRQPNAQIVLVVHPRRQDKSPLMPRYALVRILRPVPTIHRETGYGFRFRANDGREPPHVHVEGNGGRAKFWLPDGRLVWGERYNRRQLAAIQTIVVEHAEDWLRRWHDFFD